MPEVLHCLTGQHDLWLVCLAGLVCLFSSLTAVSLIHRARDCAGGWVRRGWLTTSAVATGFGIWSTHFIAMLAYRPGIPIGYDVELTLASVVIAIAVTAIGLAIYLWRTGARFAMAGGAVLGAGIAAMHYTGMAAVRVPGYLSYDWSLVGASIVLGIGLGSLALWATDRLRSTWGSITATGILTLAICTMHFCAMGAVAVVPVAGTVVSDSILSQEWLAVAIAAATATVTVLCLATSLFDQRLVRRTLVEARRLETLANASTEGIVILVGNRIEYGNTRFLAMTESTQSGLAGRSLFDFVDEHAFHVATTNLEEAIADAVETTLAGASRPVPVAMLADRLEGGTDGRMVVVLRDLTEQKRSQARIEYLAHHDALTGLPNRVRFNDRLEHDLTRAVRSRENLAVMCLDLDRFKEVNDTLGHGAGDELLQQVSERLSATVRDTDTVARLGGDEFAIVQVGNSHPEDAQHLAGRLRVVVDAPFELSAGVVDISASIGVAVFPDDGRTADVLLRNADTALYRAKAEGRNGYQFFEDEMDRAMRDRRELESDLRNSIARNELFLEYQPQADTQSGEVVGFEALVRWQHPTRGRLAPDEFIGLAEDCGFITQLGRWVLTRACRDATAWSTPLKVAVNLSPIQFQHDLSGDVARVLTETGLAPARLELEITEGVLLADRSRAITILNELKALGVSIAMDDFGTGYSSLSYLQSFPFDKIKIDRSFVAGLSDNADARAIVNAVIGLGHALNLPVVAEGVENPIQLEMLRQASCAEVQGYLIGRPATIQTFAQVFDAGGPRRAPRNDRDSEVSGG